MNTIVKLGVASALALGYATAQASISQPSSGSSDLILFAEVLNSSGGVVASYARDTGLSIDSLLPSSSLHAQGTTVPSTGFTDVTLPSFNIAADANMTAFLAQDAAGDVVEWSLQAGQYANGSTTTGSIAVTGDAKFLTTAPGGVSTVIAKSTVGNLTHWASIDGTVTALNGNITSGSSVTGSNPATSGVWDATATGATVANWFSNGPTTFTGTPADQRGGSQTLYGVTGNGGSSVTKGQVYALGTVQLTADGNLVSAVPIPAAVWLLGSGLLGLAGVGRRRAAAQV